MPGTSSNLGVEDLDNLDSPCAVLALSPGGVNEDELCSGLIPSGQSEERKLLIVSYDGTPDEELSNWRRKLGQLPEVTGIIAVGETTRSAATTTQAGPGGQRPVSIDTISDPSDLTGVAMAISAYVDAWSNSTAMPVVCFHSITSLLSQTDEDRAFKFLHATTGRLRKMGAISHFHLDPQKFDLGTLNRYKALFSVVVEIGEDEAVSVQKRR